MIKIDIVDLKSPYLPAVKSLWRKHSATLGLYPDGAFQERAAAQHILGAVRDGELIGYLLYYTTKTRRTARITHLCVASDSQGSGVARKLTDALKHRTKGLRGINLSCRRDFPAHDMWPKLGFSFAREVIGRSSDGHKLTCYWFEHGETTLFSEVDSASEGQIRAVIDANVFFDLEHSQRPSAEESGGLLADWIQPEVTLFVTPELDHEIGHNENAVELRPPERSSEPLLPRVGSRTGI
ncbi:MAG UNVERIFIED_CONTAM: GNAT family N-acetyltransferase [Planctomycetaceae bacterium]|jgi:GNAT superfamily N-acetyltransferase